MNRKKQLSAALMIFFAGISAFSQQTGPDKFHKNLSENFRKPHLKNFRAHSSRTGGKILWESGVRLTDEKRTKALKLKIDPEGAPGAGRGPEIISNYYTHYGTYAVLLRIPDVKEIQPDVGAVVGYFTYHADSIQGLSEIDVEWLIADPEIIYIGTWTGQRGDLRRIGRTINLAKGIIYSTSYRERKSGLRRQLYGIQSKPDSIPRIEGFNAASQFNTYGFDWYPDRIRWWMINPTTTDTLVLWDYTGSLEGIPQHRTRYRVNFWHTNDWPVQTNPGSIEKPAYPYETEIDWVYYKPLSRRRLKKYIN